MNAAQQEAYLRFREAMDAFFELLMPGPPQAQASTPVTTTARQPTIVRPKLTLPVSTTPAKAGSALTETVRKANLPAASAIALKIMKVIGSENPQLVPGVTGQLAIERIPYDVTLVQQAIEAARAQL